MDLEVVSFVFKCLTIIASDKKYKVSATMVEAISLLVSTEEFSAGINILWEADPAIMRELQFAIKKAKDEQS